MNCTVLSWNVWSRDGLGFRWANRRKPLLEFVRRVEADVVGLQEVRTSWLDDFKAALPDYECVSLSREDHLHAECTPVFIRKSSLTLVRADSSWLSETPTVISRGWDGMHPRVVVFCSLKTVEGGFPLVVANTHLDHWGKLARRKSVELLRTLMEKACLHQPGVLMGDFNFRPVEEPYRMMTGDGVYIDCLPAGSSVTWRGWGLGSLGQARLDYLFSRNLKLEECRTIHPPWEKRRLSDHDAVWARFTLGE